MEGDALSSPIFLGQSGKRQSVSLHDHLSWRPVPDDNFEDVFFIRYESHFLFFRLLSDESLGVISILHGQMDIPLRLREDAMRDDAMEG